jgi:hypothetical protein
MLSVAYFYWYAERHYAECRSAMSTLLFARQLCRPNVCRSNGFWPKEVVLFLYFDSAQTKDTNPINKKILNKKKTLESDKENKHLG